MLQAYFYEFLQSPLKHRIFIFRDSSEAQDAFEVCKYKRLRDERFPNAYILSDFRAKKGDDLRSYSLEFSTLLLELGRFYNDKNTILLCPLHSILYPLPREDKLQTLTLKQGEKCDFLDLQQKLFCYGFEAATLTHSPKEIAIHGDIIDIFPINYDNPIRISFFDDEIESIRFFDSATQMCFGENLSEAAIFPALFSLNSKAYENLTRLSQNSAYDAFIKDIVSLGFWFLDDGLITSRYPSILSPNAKLELAELGALESLAEIDFKAFDALPVITPSEKYSDLSAESTAVARIFKLHKAKKRILLCMNDLLLQTLEIPQGVEVIKSNIALNILTPSEIILSLHKPAKHKALPKATIKLNELDKGDYIVHSDYGIGILNGIVQATVLESTSEFVEILYQNDDKLLLPTHNLHLLSKYVSSSSLPPQIDRLGKGNFARLKERARPKLLAIAQEIIDIAATRELIKGKVIDINNVEIDIFKQNSGFTLTSDQEKSIAEIFSDLGSQKVMDRLLIGDVGFGKTEVAMNAIFATIKSDYQAALIVPTTILANQHFNTLQARFAPFNISIAKLDRTSRDKKAILQGLKNGEIRVVVGTHSLLNADFKNLGLVVLDEEHKFGVKQKEQLKNLTKDIHILSMSATPIPRTLNLALSRLKTKSELNTPPMMRIPPKTFVKNYSNVLVKDAIMRELRRNGQIFYIHNNIARIERRKAELLQILPKLRISVLHSQIPQQQSEDIMLDFANGKVDLLLSTSIIESGIHLPNANTIIVDNADGFGVADLHQLRGRIGRGDREGYCYFFVNDKDLITPEARKRLVSLESNSYLGSGGVLSYADLEIRGGGNILGEAQSGHIKNIGYHLYLQMLEDAINALSGKDIGNKASVDIRLSVSAYLSARMIPADSVRLDLYRRLANVVSQDEIFDIEREITDRFGALDDCSMRFLQLIFIKCLANKHRIKSITNFANRVTFTLENGDRHTIEAKERDDNSVLEAAIAYLREVRD